MNSANNPIEIRLSDTSQLPAATEKRRCMRRLYHGKVSLSRVKKSAVALLPRGSPSIGLRAFSRSCRAPRLARLCLCGRRAARQNHDCRDGPKPQHSEENDTPQAIYSRDRSVLCRCSGFWEISVRHNVAISCIVTKRCARFLRCA